MNSHRTDLAAALLLLAIALFGDAFIDYFDNGRFSKRVAYAESQQCYTESVWCELANVCAVECGR